MTPPEPAEFRVSRKKSSRISAIWLVPLVAVAVALIIAWQAIASRGPLIEITFTNGEGITASQTVLKFRDVKIGSVEKIRFGDDLKKVIVSVRVENEVAPFINSDAQFWVVRPEVSASGVSGLSTLLGGVYLEGAWDSTPGPTHYSFVGLESRPLITGNEPGIEFVLSAPDAGRIQAGAPIVFRGVTVGFIDKPELAADGSALTARAFVHAPHDKLITTATRFWGTGGFQVSFGASGLKVSVANLAALVQGGVSFSSFDSNGVPVETGHVFNVYSDQPDAADAAFQPGSTAGVPVAIIFDGSVSGLTPGATVEFDGLRIGAVTAVSPFVVTVDGKDEIRLRIETSIDPSRVGLPSGAGKDDLVTFFSNLVDQGYRARLASQGLLGATLKVEILQVDNAPVAKVELAADGTPILPTAPAALSDVAESAKGALKRIQDLPIEALFQSATDLVANVNKIVASPKIQGLPGQISGVIDDAAGILSSDAIKNLAGEAEQTLAALREIVTRVQQSEALTDLLAALERTDAIAKSVETTAAGLPELVASIDKLTAKANALPLDDLVASVTTLVDSAKSLLSSEDTAQIPAALASSLNEVSAALADLRAGGAVTNVNETLASASAAAAAVEEAAKSLPQLSARLDGLVAQAETLVSTYGAQSTFNVQTLAMLQDLRNTSRAITALAQQIQRKPNSLLIGR